MADDAGAMLVRSGLVSASALEDARARVEQVGGTIGEQLVSAGIIGDDALTDFYRQRLLVPLCNPNTLARLSAKVVAVIPSDMAIELRAVPVSFDNDNNLTVAMSDPSDRHAVDEIAFFTGAYVVRAVATQMQIAWCLAHYYGHLTPLGTRLMRGGDPAVTTQPSAPKPRTRGHTGKVNASRHRVLAPITSQVAIQRPNSADLDDPTPGPISPVTVTPLPMRADDDGIPDIPRARTASGEIRLPRAASIKPPPPVEEQSGPVITIEVSDEATAPATMPPRRRVPARTDPPELAARAGEVSARTAPILKVELDSPTVMIADDIETPTTVIARPKDVDEPVVIHSQFDRDRDRDSQPIMLGTALRKRPSDPPGTEPATSSTPTLRPASIVEDDEAEDAPAFDDIGPDDDTDVVVLDAPKSGKRRARTEKRTQIGMGAVPAATRMHRDTDADGMPAMIDDAPTSQMDVAMLPDDGATRFDAVAAPPNLRRAQTTDEEDPPAPPPPPASAVTAARRTMVGVAAAPTGPTADAAPPPTTTPPATRRAIDHDDVDDGWGHSEGTDPAAVAASAPADATIPPVLLGDMPGTIPVENAPVDAAPLVAAPPSPPSETEVSAGHPIVRELEDATARAIELIRRLDNARDRDEVVGIMVEHLASSHRRAGFFSIRPLGASPGASLTGAPRGATELALFSMRPTLASIPSATLRLDRPSTLEDVVGTRLPYRGPMHDDASRTFLAQVLGTCPPEILLVPVTVRERVVGVLFGEHRVRHTFDDQLSLAARAAGLSLERILAKQKR